MSDIMPLSSKMRFLRTGSVGGKLEVGGGKPSGGDGELCIVESSVDSPSVMSTFSTGDDDFPRKDPNMLNPDVLDGVRAICDLV